MQTYTSPGVFLEELQPVRSQDRPTAIPAFLGYVRHRHEAPHSMQHWPQFETHFGQPVGNGHLAYAVRGFFENGGKLCYVIPLHPGKSPERALLDAVETLETLQEPDLVCAPDLTVDESGEARSVAEIAALQAILIHPGPQGGEMRMPRHFCILDSPRGLDPTAEREYCVALRQAAKGRGASELELAGAALYYPWVAVARFSPPNEPPAVGGDVETVLTPPCGHIAGIYGRTDRAAGIRKAPANEPLDGVLDLEVQLSATDQGRIFVSGEGEQLPAGAINCLRAFPGRGIRIWGARTLSSDVEWRYVNVRRLFLDAIRSIEQRMAAMAFEPSSPDLWARIRRELNAYCFWLFRSGALKGTTTSEAFYVRCDETINPREIRDQGMVVAEVGLAAARPYEFIIIRLVQHDGEMSITGESAAET